MRVLDLFAGIGGFSLGLERAGMHTVAFCERDAWCRAVLARHWPGVPCYDDIRELSGARLRVDGIAVDLIAGGFPCQDISTAGRGAGIDAPRSGLWREFARLVGEVRPRYIIVENVANLLRRHAGRVLGDLAALGYDAEWHCLQAADVGAPHRRDRVWIIAYDRARVRRDDRPAPVSDALRRRLERRGAESERAHARPGASSRVWAWPREPRLARVVDGFPGRVDAVRALGNAVVPQLVELIGLAVMDVAA